MRIHITLVGGQMMPVYLGIKNTELDKIILIHSSDSLKNAEQIEKIYREKCLLVEFSPVDYNSIKDSIDKLLTKYKEDDISINLSSGTKPWSILFALQTQGMKNITLLYIDQNNVLYDYTQHKKLECTGLTMEELMRYNGYIPNSYGLLNDYTDEDLDMLEKIKSARKTNFSEFKNLTVLSKEYSKVLENKESGLFQTSKGSYIEWDRNKSIIDLSLKTKYRYRSFYFKSPNIMRLIFNTGWFEYEVAELISKWKYAKEVWLNIIYPYDNQNPKNEIDIIVNTGYKLLMIECKTQIVDNTNIDKFYTAVKTYGGLSSKAIFITEEKMKEQAKEKCFDHKILNFSFAEYKCRQDAQKALFQLLDKELFNINTK